MGYGNELSNGHTTIYLPSTGWLQPNINDSHFWGLVDHVATCYLFRSSQFTAPRNVCGGWEGTKMSAVKHGNAGDTGLGIPPFQAARNGCH